MTVNEAVETAQRLAASINAAPADPNPAIAESNYADKQLDDELKRMLVKTRELENKTLRQDRKERKKYASKIFYLTCAWAALIFVILFLLGFGAVNLSDKVIITLITSTTINFFGFFLLVTRYLFYTPAREKEKAPTSRIKTAKQEG